LPLELKCAQFDERFPFTPYYVGYGKNPQQRWKTHQRGTIRLVYVLRTATWQRMSNRSYKPRLREEYDEGLTDPVFDISHGIVCFNRFQKPEDYLTSSWNNLECLESKLQENEAN
jgi:hypothetical protein